MGLFRPSVEFAITRGQQAHLALCAHHIFFTIPWPKVPQLLPAPKRECGIRLGRSIASAAGEYYCKRRLGDKYMQQY